MSQYSSLEQKTAHSQNGIKMSNEIMTMPDMGLTLSPEIAAFFSDNANVGTENVAGGSLPQLKITEANSKNEMVNGQYAPTGSLFYAPTKEVFESPLVSVLSISRPFYTVKIDQKTGQDVIDPDTGFKVTQFNQMVGGIILENMQPFVVIVKGTRLSYLWEFGTLMRPYTRSKKSPVPMFAFKVKLTTKEIENASGRNHVIIYTPVTDDNGHMQIVTDPEVLQVLRSGVDSVEEMFEGFISRKEVDKLTGESIMQSERAPMGTLEDITPPDDLSNEASPEAEAIASDIPF